MHKARELQAELGYTEWRNFNNVVRKAIAVINSTGHEGRILGVTRSVKIGNGAIRKIADYDINDAARDLIKKIASNKKLHAWYTVSCETTILNLLKKYCVHKGIEYEHQFQLGEYFYDFKAGNTLIEYDEPHHHSDSKQRAIDLQKDLYAKSRGYNVMRFGLDDDIVDIIIALGIS